MARKVLSPVTDDFLDVDGLLDGGTHWDGVDHLETLPGWDVVNRVEPRKPSTEAKKIPLTEALETKKRDSSELPHCI